MASPTGDSADRRRYVRHKLELAARLESAPNRNQRCTVRDYCSGGMLIQLHPSDASNAQLEAGQRVQLSTDLLTPKGTRAVTLKANVVWTRGDYLGVAFDTPSDAIVEALKHHDAMARPSDRMPPASTMPGEARVLAKLRHVAQGELPPLLRELLLSTVQGVMQSAERATSINEQQQVYADLNALERLRNSDLLTRNVLDLAFNPQAMESAEPQPQPGELTLVDPDDFERWLEASRIANSLEGRFESPLAELGSRLAGLRDDSIPDALTVPLEPQHFTDALKQVAKQLELGSTSRQVLFEQAGRVLGARLEGLYDLLRTALDTCGVPAAKPARPVQPMRHNDRAQAKTDTDSRPAQPTGREPDRHGAAPSESRLNLSAPDQRLLDTLIEHERQQRESQARDLLQRVVEQPIVTESMADWLHQLDGLLLQQAAGDRDFFQNPQHPLRTIIDELGHLQLFRPVPDANPREDTLRAQVSDLLTPLARGDADVAEMRAIAQQIAQLASEQSDLYQHNVERVVELNNGRDRARRAREAVTEELNRRYAGRKVPAVTPELLAVGWRSALELAQRKGAGRDSRYADQLELLDQLVALLGGEAVAPRTPLMRTRELLERIATELANVAFDPYKRNALESHLRRALSGPRSLDPALIVMPELQGGPSKPSSETLPQDIDPSAWREALTQCEKVRIGDRLHFSSGAGPPQDLRVAWIRDDRELFVLVDHRGIQVRELDLAQLATGLHRRHIQRRGADGQPISERAVESILDDMQNRLAHQVVHDSLTGLIDRRQFQTQLDHWLARRERHGVLLWADIDQFRLVNDIHGYDTGDRLLIATARLLETSDGNKVLGHLGGDRFVALLPNADLERGSAWAEAIRQSVQHMKFEWYGQSLGLSVSIGVVDLTTYEQRGEAAMHAAEYALAAAKTAGGNQVHLYRTDDPDIARQKENTHWVVQVDEALEKGQLHLRCQPIVPVRPQDGLASYYEVLLGVASPSSEALPIAEFIAAAERYRRMRAVDRWVTQTVMAWIAAHRERMPLLHSFAVNLSGQTASDPSFVTFLRQQFEKTGIEPAWLHFEITETAAMSNLTQGAGIVQDIKALGCKVALDDFGSGLASYSYLKELPVDWVKIDGVFVRKVAASQEDRAIVKSINEIGHFLGKQTIAEYVADEVIYQSVRELGVDFAQGYAISRPHLLDELSRPRASSANH